MKTSLLGRIAIMSHEAIVATRYKDSEGVWTIGVGVTAAAGAAINPSTFKGRITIQQAIDLFEKVLVKYERAVNRAIKVPIEQHQFDALVSFHYNTGAIARANATKLINNREYEQGADALMGWCKPIELQSRRMAEVRLFKNCDYGDGKVMLYTATKSGNIRWSEGRIIDIDKHLALEISESALPIPRSIPKPTPRPEPEAPIQLPMPDSVEPKSVPLEKFETEEALEDVTNPIVEDALREQGSRTIQHADKVQSRSFWMKVWSALSTGALAPVFAFIEGVPAWAKGLVLLAVIGLVLVVILAELQKTSATEIRTARVDDAKSGRNLSRLDFLVAAIRGR